MTGRLAAWPFHAILATAAAVCWSTAMAWVAAVITGLLAVTGAGMEAIARRYRGQPAAPPPHQVRCRADVIRSVPAADARKALTAGAVTNREKGTDHGQEL